jgi:hypothetical protein
MLGVRRLAAKIRAPYFRASHHCAKAALDRAMDMIVGFDMVYSAEMNSTSENMKLSSISPSTIRQLQAELQHYQQ